MKKWDKMFTRKGGRLFWKESRGRAKAGSPAGTPHGDGYRTVRISGKAVYEHRIIHEMATGKKVRSGDIDHKNRNRSDNRPSNLKQVTRSDNLKNRNSWAKPKPKSATTTKNKAAKPALKKVKARVKRRTTKK